MNISRQDLFFLLCCLLLGALAELSFFHTSVGVSYLVFLSGFYLVFFIRFRKFAFRQRRMGMLLMLVIWILAAHYLLYDQALFKALNVLVIPCLVVAHLVLITKPKHIRWYKPLFIKRMALTIIDAFAYNTVYSKAMYGSLFKNMNRETSEVIKKILTGLLIGVPLLLVIVGLLMQADQAFQEMLGGIPSWFMHVEFNVMIVRVLLVLALGWLFFGIFEVLPRNRGDKEQESRNENKNKQDGIVSLTVLILLNIVYALFTIVQFTYFFGGELQGGMSYAEYARRGFFELLFVSLVNLTTLLIMLFLNKPKLIGVGYTLKVMYSLLIVFSGVLLTSAFQRLTLYEQHYGYTMDRVLPHVFMIFLIVIFIYTLVRVWVERLPLIHFYIITGLLFYTGLNAVNVEQWIVERNIERYEETGKIDVKYLESMSYTGVGGLLDLYEKAPDYPKLERILEEKKRWWKESAEENSWQSFNIQKHKVLERLKQWEG